VRTPPRARFSEVEGGGRGEPQAGLSNVLGPRIVCNVDRWPPPGSKVRRPIPAPDAQGPRHVRPPEASARLPQRKRRLWVVALASSALAIAGATAAAADGLLQFRDPGPSELTFPNQITCRQGTAVCTPGWSPDGQAFRLFKIGESGEDVQIVGAGVDTGNGTQVTPLVCTRAGNDIRCGSQPPGGEKQLGMYLPG
jgi:hypothetical protein